MPTWYHIENEAELPSPALLLYADRIEHNLALMLQIAGGPARLRPHVKTHKLAPLVRRQMELGITKFKCATIAEAEMCAAENAPDVLLAMPCAGHANAARLAKLAKLFPQTTFSTLADDEETVRFLASAAQQNNVTFGVFIDIDCGMGRTGIQPGHKAAFIASTIRDTPRLQFAGVHAYDGHIHDADLDTRNQRCTAAFEPVIAFVKELRGQGLIIKEFLCGGSPTFGIHASHPDRTLSPGTTVLWDFGYAERFPEDLPFLPAAVILSRVISKPTGDHITLDLGHKSVAAENPHPRVRFEELDGEDVPVLMQSEEHLVLNVGQSERFHIGQSLHGIPRHVCPTVALHGEAIVIRNGHVAETWPITARNRRITV
jgi:D-serine deaminase-like pyridoxal phosphate-dependent protein